MTETAEVKKPAFTVEELETKKLDLLSKAEQAAKSMNLDELKKFANEASAIGKMIEQSKKSETDKAKEANKALIDTLLESLRQDMIGFAKSKQTIYDKLSALGNVVQTIRLETDLTDVTGLTVFYAGEKKAVKKAVTKSEKAEKSDNGETKTHVAKQVRLAGGEVMSTKAFVIKFANESEKASKTYQKWLCAKSLVAKIAKREGATVEDKG